MKTIAIWAPLKYANYGDDLQAILLEDVIRKAGYETIVFQLDIHLAQQYNITSAHSEDDLLRNASICIIAGGSFLMPINPIKRWLHKDYREIENSYIKLYKKCLKYNVPLLPISIGGDGKCHKLFWKIPLSRYHIIKSDIFLNGTVRLKDDLKYLNDKTKKNFIYYPDMLLQAGKMMQIKSTNENKTIKKKIGLNLKKGKYIDYRILDSIFQYANTHDDIEFYFIRSHMKSADINYEFMPIKESKNIYCINYENPKQLLSLLSSFHCIISSKLHIGLTALSVGTPFISYRGQGKTHAFLKSIDGAWAIINDINFEELKNNFIDKGKNIILNQYNNSAITTMISESKHHYEFCLDKVKNLTSHRIL